MGQLGFFVVIVAVYFYSVETVQIPCDVEAVEWSDELKESLQRGGYWTFLYRENYSNNARYPILDGFLRGLKLIRTSMKLMNNGIAVVYGYTMIDENEGADLNDVGMDKVELVMDESKAIFRYPPQFESITIRWNTETEMYDTVTKFTSLRREENTFALVHEEDDGIFRIYRTCDGRSTWVQFDDSVADHLGLMMRGAAPNAMRLPPSIDISILYRTVMQKLDEMGITGQEYHILHSEESSETGRQFALVHLAAQFIEG